MKKLQVSWPLWFSITLILGMWVGYSLKKNIPDSQGFLSRPKKASVQEVMELLEKRYVDPIATDSLSETAIEGMLQQLDPHTLYIPAQLTAAANEDLQGNFEGIGVEFFIIADTVHAVRVIPGGPSEKAGIQAGDQFLKVGDSVIAGTGITNEGIKKLLRGPAGSTVQLTLLRSHHPLTLAIKRGTIPKPAIDAAFLLDQRIGFIHLNKFSQTAYVEFMQHLEQLQKKGMQELMLDLRGNGGGILDQAVQIADEFLSDERLILYTEGEHHPKKEYRCKRPGLFENGKLVVLIDEFSASAAEVLAGALQDWDRAIVVGRRSFGKGLVQEPFSLRNGAELRLTVARYYTPAGRNIQKPFSENHNEYNEEVYRRVHEALNGRTDTLARTGKPFKTLVKKRTVYGGGGIFPDFPIPADTFRLFPAFPEIFASPILSRFAYIYYVGNRDYFNRFNSPESFARSFTLSPAIWQAFLDYCRREGAVIGKRTAAETALLQQAVAGALAQQAWNVEGYYRLTSSQDPCLRKATELLKEK